MGILGHAEALGEAVVGVARLASTAALQAEEAMAEQSEATISHQPSEATIHLFANFCGVTQQSTGKHSLLANVRKEVSLKYL